MKFFIYFQLDNWINFLTNTGRLLRHDEIFSVNQWQYNKNFVERQKRKYIYSRRVYMCIDRIHCVEFRYTQHTRLLVRVLVLLLLITSTTHYQHPVSIRSFFFDGEHGILSNYLMIPVPLRQSRPCGEYEWRFFLFYLNWANFIYLFFFFFRYLSPHKIFIC